MHSFVHATEHATEEAAFQLENRFVSAAPILLPLYLMPITVVEIGLERLAQSICLPYEGQLKSPLGVVTA